MLTIEVMGTLVFIVGFCLLVLSVLATIIQIGTIGEPERFILFIVGALTCILGYYMGTQTRD